MSIGSVLIVDDDDRVTTAIAARLESIGCRCYTAGCGAHAIAEFEGRRIDIVIADVNMPAGGGVLLAEALREMSLAPIIFITGAAEEHAGELAAIPNAIVLAKPFETQRLVALVETRLAR